jgi:type I restriction enzyme S subunit
VDKKTREGEAPVRLCNYTDVYYSDTINSTDGFMEATATPEEVTRFQLHKDDVLITKDSESRDDIAVPAYVARDLPGVLCGYHLALVRPQQEEVIGRFLHYCFLEGSVAHQFTVGANGITRFGLSQDVLNDAHLPVPPLPTQRTIASFLDRETARIDTLIKKKERLLELLEEKRTALITQAVIKGLDPDVPMKDSGVEWLGEIPAHWEVVPLKRLLVKPLQYGANESGVTFDPKLPRYIRITDIDHASELRSLDQAQSLPEDRAAGYIVGEGDVLFARSGATAGKSFLIRPSMGCAAFAGYLIRAVPHPSRLIGEWLWSYSRSSAYLRWLASIFVQATIQNVSAEKYGNLPVPCPPAGEQQRILARLSTPGARLDRLRSKVERAVELLREYRTALISAAVTGQLDIPAEDPAA